MEIRQICGRTWIYQNTVTIPFYRLSDRDVVLLDSGFATKDREPLTSFFRDEHLHVAAIIGSHAHQDHAGNFAYFQQRHGAEIILPEAEASMLSSLHMLRVMYPTDTLFEAQQSFSGLLMRADRTFPPEPQSLQIQDACFQIIPLPGHTMGHTGVVTPDDVFYVGDAIVDKQTLSRIRLPSTYSWEDDLASKDSLRREKHSCYILAHSGYYEDISELIDLNIDDHMQYVKTLLSLLQRPVSISQYEKQVWQSLHIDCHTVMGIMKFRRNLRCVMEYLLSTGAVVTQFEDGMTLYRPA